MVKFHFFSVLGSVNPHPWTDQGEIWHGGAVPNLTLIGATCRPYGAKEKPKNRPVSKNNTGRAACADPAGKKGLRKSADYMTV